MAEDGQSDFEGTKKSSASIRDASPPPSATVAPPEHDSEDTFHQLMSIFIDQPIGSMSISPANRDVALGAKKGLFIVDLQNPYDPPRYLPHQSAWEVADVQWNPFPARSEWVVATSSQQAVVYNLSLSPAFSVSPIEHALYGHDRAVTDVNWSPGGPELLATCAMDGWVMAWDLRTGYGSMGRGRKPIWRVCGWGSPATQVKFNRREPHVIASSHDNLVHIWDDRMGAAPVETIHGHSAKIYGIDWSRKDAKKIITCSLDQSFKSWRLGEVQQPLRSVTTSSPIWRARWLPFGDGVLSLPQRSDHALSVWSYKTEDTNEQPKPVARFEGAREGVKEYVWRTRGGEDLEHDDRQFQLVTWARDRRLRLWPISDSLMKDVGHVKGAPIEVPVSRRGGPDISYRSFFETPAPPLPISFTPATPASTIPKHLSSGASLLSASLSSPPTPSLLTSSLRNASLPTSPQSKENVPLPPAPLPYPVTAEAKAATATMSTTRVRNRREKEHDRLAWMEGVKIIRPPQAVEAPAVDEPEQIHPDGADEQAVDPSTRANSVVRGTDAGTVTAREGDETERADSVLSGESRQTGTAVGKEYLYANLGEEITSVVRRFPRINFEKVHVAGRTCTVSLYSPLFVRATFTFPRTYPASSPPQIELERSVDITLKQRAVILQGVRRLMAHRAERGLPSLEQALRYLLGDRSVELADDEDDEEAEEALDGSTPNLAADILRNNVNVPPPRRGGACFGPSGQLVVFFPSNVLAPPPSDGDGTASPPNELEPVPKRKFPLRLSEAFGNLPSESPDYEGEYQEADEALQVTKAHGFRSYSALRGKRRKSAAAADLAPSFSTIVKIKDVSHLSLVSPDRAPCSLSRPPVEVAREAALSAAALKDLLLTKVWTTMVAFLENGLGTDGGELTYRRESLLAERLLQELLKFLAHLKDIQTLGVIACLLEAHTRAVEDAIKQREANRQPEPDYFSQRHRPIEPLNDVDSSGERTPLPTAASLRCARGESHSPKPSWGNLSVSGFFNASMLSLRSASSSSPSSPDRTPSTTRPASLGAASASPATSPGFAKSPLRAQQSVPSAMHHHQDGEHAASAGARSKTSPTVTFGGTSVALIPSKSPAPQAVLSQDEKPAARKRVAISLNEAFNLHKPMSWWLTDRAQLELELIRLSYAELLYRWGQHVERAHVLKLCRSAVKPSERNQVAVARLREANGLGPTATIETTPACTQCGAVIRHGEGSCGKCRKRQRATLCVLCHLPVSGLMQSCTTCCHVGHLDCLQRWFSSAEACPSGCGCSCVTHGGSSGLFLVPRSRFTASVDPPAGPAASGAGVLSKPVRVSTPSWAGLGGAAGAGAGGGGGRGGGKATPDKPLLTGYASFG
ncbi:hypothetical protein DMC30DRAFT_416147 [Rhodotorula diobovata]|uniref:RWD domain-containing protein n=1 Tax=Rhodotorula diobovata TaxID=5288 RepID=A0A5C5FXF8_9BASI|nr:hypothetical protein DMC30DRAFT_416147 [Rhodotorula diobovata]